MAEETDGPLPISALAGLNSLMKVVVIGDSGVGKTALLRRFTEDRFIEEHQATIGADLSMKRVRLESGAEVTLQIWDTAGQERFESLSAAFYRGSNACAVVYDLTDRRSFENVKKWKTQFIDKASDPHSGDIRFLLLGNKSDLSARQVPKADAQQLAEQEDMLCFEASARDGDGVTEAFLALAEDAAKEEPVAFYSEDAEEKIKIEVEKDAPGVCACTLT